MPNKTTKLVTRTVPAGALALMLVLSGCDMPGTGATARSEDVVSTKSATGSTKANDMMESTEDGAGFMADVAAPEGQAVSDQEQSVPDQGQAEGDSQGEVPSDAMIRKSASISLSSRDFDKATQALSEIVKRYSVVTLQDSTDTDSYYGTGGGRHRSRNVQLRVRSEQFDEVCDLVTDGQTWEVQSLEKGAEDVTKQYSDTEQRIEALQTRYEWYRKKLEETTDPGLAQTYSESMFDSLDEITRLQNQNSDLRTDVQYSVMSIRLSEDTTVEDINPSNGIWDDLGDEVEALPDRILGAFGMFLYVIVRLLPTLIILAILGLVAFLIARPLVRRSKRTREERMAAMRAQQAQQPMRQVPGSAYTPRPGAPVPPQGVTAPPRPMPATDVASHDTDLADAPGVPTDADATQDESTGNESDAVAEAPSFDSFGVATEDETESTGASDHAEAQTEQIPAVLMNIEPELPVADYKPVAGEGDGADAPGEAEPSDTDMGIGLMGELEYDIDDSDEDADAFGFDGDDFGDLGDMPDTEGLD